MNNGWQTFITSFKTVCQYWQLVLIVWVINLIPAFCLTLIPAASLFPYSYNPIISQVADGVDGWQVMETLLSPLTPSNTEDEITPTDFDIQRQFLAMGSIIFACILPLAGLSTAFLRGGLLATYTNQPKAFSMRYFLSNCWHWFGVFIVQNILQILSLLIIFGVFIISVTMATYLGTITFWFTLPIICCLLVCWLAQWELTAALAINNNNHNIFQATIQATIYLLKVPLTWLSLYIPTLILLLLGHGVYRYGLRPAFPLNGWMLLLTIQQLFILWRLTLRLVRYAGNLIIIKQTHPLIENSVIIG